jgi:hypothetical protein
MPAALRLPDIPAALSHIWEWFCELSGARSGNGGGPNPIAYTEIEAWARVTGRLIAPRDVHGIMALDSAFFAQLAEQDRKRDAARRLQAARGGGR